MSKYKCECWEWSSPPAALSLALSVSPPWLGYFVSLTNGEPLLSEDTCSYPSPPHPPASMGEEIHPFLPHSATDRCVACVLGYCFTVVCDGSCSSVADQHRKHKLKWGGFGKKSKE